MFDLITVKSVIEAIIARSILEYVSFFFAFFAVSSFMSSIRKAVKTKAALDAAGAYSEEELRSFYPGVIWPIIQGSLINGVIGGVLGVILRGLLNMSV